MKIFLDCGHGGSDPRAVHGGLIEKNMTLVCAKAACELLKRNGQTVMLSRTDDRYMTLNERAKMANAWGADAFISFHFNAGGGSRGEVIHSVYGGKGKELAEKIAEQIKRLGQSTVRIYSKAASSGNGDYFTVIAKTDMPAVIVEPCFIDSLDKHLADSINKQYSVGGAIAVGILSYLGINYEGDNFMELTEVNDIVYELKIREIITDSELWLEKLKDDSNSYWLAKKAVDFIRKSEVQK